MDHNSTLKTFARKVVLSKSVNPILKVVRLILPTQKIL